MNVIVASTEEASWLC